MVNFQQIAEDCLAGKLSGTFVLRDGSEVKSSHLRKLPSSKCLICSYGLCEWYISDTGNAYGDTGYLYKSSIKAFIPDMKKQQITIDIPEGMEVIREETPGEIKIKFVEKKLTYADIVSQLLTREDTSKPIYEFWSDKIHEDPSKSFYKKVEVLRKLTNIRNYFGKPDGTKSGFYIYKFDEKFKIATTSHPAIYASDVVAFAEREHAEEAIRILGEELKYLFEPW